MCMLLTAQPQNKNAININTTSPPPLITMKKLPLQTMVLAFRFQTIKSFHVPRYIFSATSSLPRFPTHFNHDHNKCNSKLRRQLSTSAPMSMSTSSSSAESPIPSSSFVHRRRRIGIIGGGASGMFSATAAADAVQKYLSQQPSADTAAGCDVIVFEGTSKTMSKVRISGGGRCNGK